MLISTFSYISSVIWKPFTTLPLSFADNLSVSQFFTAQHLQLFVGMCSIILLFQMQLSFIKLNSLLC